MTDQIIDAAASARPTAVDMVRQYALDDCGGIESFVARLGPSLTPYALSFPSVARQLRDQADRGRGAFAHEIATELSKAGIGSTSRRGAPTPTVLNVEDSPQLEPAHDQAHRLWKAARDADSTLHTLPQVYAWLQGRPEYAKKLHCPGQRGRWSLKTFARYVSEARKTIEGPKHRAHPEVVPSAMLRKRRR